MEDEFNYINCVRLFADLSVFDNPKNSLSNETICIRAGDSVRFDVILLNNSTIADCTNIVSASFEIMDIGEVNRALPRNCKTLFKKEILAEFINKNITQAEIDLGKCHFSVPITSSQAYFTAGDKYLKISAYLKNGDKVTFASGWIYVAENFEADLSDNPQQSISIASELQGQIHAQNDKLNSISAELYDLTQSSNNLQEQKADKFEVASNLELQNLNINNLQLFKANSGALHFNGSGYAQCSKLLRNQQFSFAVRIKANKNDVLTGKQVNIIDTGVFYLYIHSSVQRLSVYATGNSLKSVTVEQNDRIFDGNWHSLFVTYNGIMLTLLDEFGVLLSADYSIQEQTSNTKIGTNFVGEMSDVCLFNFDITSEDALYTIEDYQNGKPIPPSLLQSTFYTDAPIVVSRTTPLVAGEIGGGSSGLSLADGVYTRTKEVTSNSYASHYLAVRNDGLTFSAGTIVDVSIGLFQTLEGSGYFGGVAINYEDNTYSEWKLSSTSGGKASFVATKPFRLIAVRFRDVTGNNVFSISPTDTSNAIEVKVNGTILALEDYTINGKVLDYSGNKNHATITGYVMGDNDTRIEAFVEAITTSTSEQN